MSDDNKSTLEPDEVDFDIVSKFGIEDELTKKLFNAGFEAGRKKANEAYSQIDPDLDGTAKTWGLLYQRDGILVLSPSEIKTLLIEIALLVNTSITLADVMRCGASEDLYNAICETDEKNEGKSL